ncbi:MAG: GNAT family N-acetyltransferase [Candidatus Obscuribacterales bacterium]|nr:GNAT family N-acetyltransferase [Candidatus Obscuribacterales bacterium]
MISFAPLKEKDLEKLHQWLNNQHVKEWWDGPISTDAVKEKYLPRILGLVPVYCFVFSLGTQPIGFVQAYRLSDFPEYAEQLGIEIKAGSACMDIFVGEPAHLHKGLGATALQLFLRDFVFSEMGACESYIAPAISNSAAIRAYGKAGFKHISNVYIQGENEPEYLMRIADEDMKEMKPCSGCAF